MIVDVAGLTVDADALVRRLRDGMAPDRGELAHPAPGRRIALVCLSLPALQANAFGLVDVPVPVLPEDVALVTVEVLARTRYGYDGCVRDDGPPGLLMVLSSSAFDGTAYGTDLVCSRTTDGRFEIVTRRHQLRRQAGAGREA